MGITSPDSLKKSASDKHFKKVLSGEEFSNQNNTELNYQEPVIFLSCALPKRLETKNEKSVLTTNNYGCSNSRRKLLKNTSLFYFLILLRSLGYSYAG